MTPYSIALQSVPLLHTIRTTLGRICILTAVIKPAESIHTLITNVIGYKFQRIQIWVKLRFPETVVKFH